MEISFTCPHCGVVTPIDESFVGQSGPCRSCDEVVTVRKEIFADPLLPQELPRSKSRLIFGLTWLNWVGVIVSFGPILLMHYLANQSGQPEIAEMQRRYSLIQIMQALKAYNADWGQLPRASWRDEQGELTLPWRVAILPYVDEHAVFDAYATSEPWNSPKNYAVTATSVKVYVHPDGEDLRSCQTGYLAVTGPGSLFVEGKNMRLADCKLKPWETIVLMEIPIEAEVHWSEPVDVDLFVQHFRSNARNDSERRFYWAHGAECAFADGSVRRLSREELEAAIQKMIASASPEDLRARFSAVGD